MHPKQTFTHLHVHTDVSPDGLGTIENLVDGAVEKGFDSLAITDHGSLGNWVTFYLETTKRGLKPILGVEAYLEYKGNVFHCTLLAKNKIGYDSLIAAQNQAVKRSPKKTVVLSLSDFEDKSGVIALTGCPSSAIHAGNYQDGLQYVVDLVDVFGRENVFVEVMFPNEEDHHTRPIEIAKQLKVPCVITNDVHFCHKEDYDIHQICVRARKGYTYDSKSLWLKSAEEMYKTALKRTGDEPFVKSAMGNTRYIVEHLVDEYDITKEPQLPKIKNAESFIIETCNKKIKSFSEPMRGRLEEQFNKEFEVFKRAGLLDYFYIVWDLHDFCNKEGILKTLRGSAVGSTMAFLLGLSEINPLEYGLLFERFYNEERIDYPDVDTDVPSDKREFVLEYAKKRWGAYPVVTQSRYSFSSLIRDLGRIIGIPHEQVERVSDFGEDSKHYEELCKEYPIVRRCVGAMLGQIRHQGKHAGGIFISSVDVPFRRLSDGTIATDWDEGPQKNLFTVGVVKFDLLGIKALSQLQDMKTYSDKVFPGTFDDPNVFRTIFESGETAGIFQYGGSQGIREYVKLVKPTSIEDLIMINALYRPGPLDAGTAQRIPEFKNKPQKFHPDIDPILESTYGVICYQEQFMQIYAKTSGLSFGEADIARKIIANAHKMKPTDKDFWSKFNELKRRFFVNGKANGYKTSTLKSMWEQIETHGRYSFNKSHSTAYAILAYKMAWYKTYSPEHFYSSLLNHSQKNIQTLILESVKNKITVVPPNINKSTERFVVDGNKIYCPLSMVKFLGESSLEHLLKIRSEGEFTSFENFNERVTRKYCNKRVRQNLFRCGAFSDFPDSPESTLDTSEIEIENELKAQYDVFGFIIPTSDVTNRIYSANNGSRICGVITEVKKRNNGYGDYRVFYLAPNGVFWTDKKPKYNEGDIVEVQLTNGVKLQKGRKLK